MRVRAIKSVFRDLEDSVTDAKAAVTTIFFAAETTPPIHDKAGIADRALRTVQEYLNELDRMIRHDDGSQLRLGAV